MSSYYRIMKKILRQNEWDTTPIKNTLEANKGGGGNLEEMMQEDSAPIPANLVEQQGALLDKELAQAQTENFNPAEPLALQESLQNPSNRPKIGTEGISKLQQIKEDMRKKQAPFKGGL